MNREQAINYLFSSGFTNEQVGEVVRALTYEPTPKDDLGVDYISRADARKAIIDHQYSDSFCEEHNIDHSINTGMALIALSDLPSVTPQLSVPEVSALTEWIEKLTKECEEAYQKGYADGMKAQEQQTFKWCTDCKEYDQEKHCCHRWSKVIRDTVEEMKQEQEPIIDKIRAEIETKYGQCKLCEFDSDYDGVYTDIGDILQILDKRKAKSEANNGNDA